MFKLFFLIKLIRFLIFLTSNVSSISKKIIFCDLEFIIPKFRAIPGLFLNFFAVFNNVKFFLSLIFFFSVLKDLSFDKLSTYNICIFSFLANRLQLLKL